MSDNVKAPNGWNLELASKPDFEQAMKRIYAWYEGEIIDRAPVRFTSHNAEYGSIHDKSRWKNLKEWWFDTEYHVEHYIQSLAGKKFLGETFPVYWPNLGPNVFAAFYGSPLKFGEVTSWAEPCVHDYSQLSALNLDMNNEYFLKLDEMTRYALERCEGKFMVGYTDLHPGLDCAAAWRDTQSLCFDFYDEPDALKEIIRLAEKDFQQVYDHFDAMLKEKRQLSVSWMNIPSFEKLHIPSCDFSAMISRNQFDEFYLPVLQEEVKPMTHNIFHLDGKGVANHIDSILEVPEITAIQWVQGLGKDAPIMQWVPLIKKIQAAGKSIVIDLDKAELEEFISLTEPHGLMLCIDSRDEEEQKEILKRVEKW